MLRLGSVSTVNLTAEISPAPEVVYQLSYQDDVVQTPDLSFGNLEGYNYRMVFVKVKNMSPRVPDAPVSATITGSDFRIAYTNCNNVILKPENSCRVGLAMRGDNTAGTKTGTITFGHLTKNISFSTTVSTAVSSLRVESEEVEIGSVSDTQSYVMRLITLLNYGEAVGSLENFTLPTGYDLIYNNCRDVKPNHRCSIRLRYNNQYTTKGVYEDEISIGDGTVTGVVYFENKERELDSVALSAPSILLINNCYPFTIDLSTKLANFTRFDETPVSFNQPVSTTSDCLDSVSTVQIPSWASTGTFYMKRPTASTFTLEATVFEKTAQKTLSFVSELIIPETIYTTISKVVNLSPVGGMTPYSYSLVSGSGSLVSNVFTAPSVVGLSQIKVMDAVGQEKTTTIDIRPTLEISPVSLYVNVNETHGFSAVGGLAPYSYAVVSGRGSINQSSGLFSALNLSGSSVVELTDSIGNSAQASIQVLDLLNISATQAHMVVNQNQNMQVSGGLAPYTYSTSSGSISASGVLTAPSIAGLVTVTVKDSLDQEATVNVQVVPVLQLSPNNQYVQVGNTLSLSASGGLAPYSFSSTNGSVNSSGLFTAPTVADNVTVTVSDALGQQAQVSVHVLGNFTLLIANSINLVVNQEYQVLVAGGLEPYEYEVVSGGGTVSEVGLYKAPALPSVAQVKISDALGQERFVTFTSYKTLAVTPTVINLVALQTSQLTVTDGLAPYTYTLSGPGSFNSGTRTYTAPNLAANATVTVKDALNQQVIVNINVFTSLQNSLSLATVVSGDRALLTITGGSGDFTVDFIQNGNIGSSVQGGYYYAGYTTTAKTEQIRIKDNTTGETKNSAVINVTPLALTRTNVNFPANSLSLKGSYLVVGDTFGAGVVSLYNASNYTLVRASTGQ